LHASQLVNQALFAANPSAFFIFPLNHLPSAFFSSLLPEPPVVRWLKNEEEKRMVETS
jgi:hypothetical protein